MIKHYGKITSPLAKRLNCEGSHSHARVLSVLCIAPHLDLFVLLGVWVRLTDPLDPISFAVSTGLVTTTSYNGPCIGGSLGPRC